MKQLYIIRHAKAEEHSFAKKDFDRNLTDSGRKRATRIAKDLAQQLTIDEHTYVLSSSANRAIQTAELFCEILGYPVTEIQQEEDIYEAFYINILQVINQVPDHIQTVLIFGHNPGLSMLAEELSNYDVDLKTSDVAHLELEEGITFAELSQSTAHFKKVFE